MLTPRSQAYTPGTRSGQAKGSRLHTLHYKETRPLSSPECSKVGFPQDALNWQNGKAVASGVLQSGGGTMQLLLRLVGLNSHGVVPMRPGWQLACRIGPHTNPFSPAGQPLSLRFGAQVQATLTAALLAASSWSETSGYCPEV